MGNVTMEMMGSLYAQERERRGRICGEMAGALIGNKASVSILKRGECRGKLPKSREEREGMTTMWFD